MLREEGRTSIGGATPISSSKRLTGAGRRKIFHQNRSM